MRPSSSTQTALLMPSLMPRTLISLPQQGADDASSHRPEQIETLTQPDLEQRPEMADDHAIHFPHRVANRRSRRKPRHVVERGWNRQGVDHSVSRKETEPQLSIHSDPIGAVNPAEALEE